MNLIFPSSVSGDVVLREEPYAAVLRAIFRVNHCAHCLKKIPTPVPCFECATVRKGHALNNVCNIFYSCTPSPPCHKHATCLLFGYSLIPPPTQSLKYRPKQTESYYEKKLLRPRKTSNSGEMSSNMPISYLQKKEDS